MGVYIDDKTLSIEEKQDSFESFINENNTYSLDEYKNREIQGLPLAIFEKNKKMYVMEGPRSHALVDGITRCGKTSGFIVPLLYMFIISKSTSNFAVVDIKSELYPILAPIMEKNGVIPIIINTKDYLHSEKFNPIEYIFDMYQDYLNVENKVSADMDKNGYYFLFRGEKIYNYEKLKNRIEIEKDVLLTQTYSEVDKTVKLIMGDYSRNTDPYWDVAASQLLKAIIVGMLEDSTEKKGRIITRENFSLKKIGEIAASFSVSNEDNVDGGYFTSRPRSSYAYLLANSVLITNANNTRNCVSSTTNAKLNETNEAIARVVLSVSTFSIEKLIDSNKKFGIFFMCRDDTKTSYQAIQLIVSRLCTILCDKAEKNEYANKLDVPFYFVLDEFGNFPKILDFGNKITVCAGKNIYFIMAIQSYAQLTNVYDKDAQTILDNTNIKYFLGSNDYQTMDYFSKSSGYKTVLSSQSISANNPREEVLSTYVYKTEQVISIENLSNLKDGECVVLQKNGKAMVSMLKKYFEWPEHKIGLEKRSVKDYVPLNERKTTSDKETIAKEKEFGCDNEYRQ